MELITKHNSESSGLETRQTSSPSTQELTSRFPTFGHFCQRFTHENAMIGAQHPTQCLTCSSPTLNDIKLAYGDGNSIAWIIYLLTFFQENINVPNKMSKYQIETCAQSIFDTYYHLKATELMLFFARLAGGMYPVEWHGYVTPTKIFTALREHFMPWRNNLLWKIDRQNQERKAKEEAQQPVCTWEEYRRMKQEVGEETIHSDNPLTMI